MCAMVNFIGEKRWFGEFLWYWGMMHPGSWTTLGAVTCCSAFVGVGDVMGNVGWGREAGATLGRVIGSSTT